MTYVAIVNVPGYLPMDDDPPVFDTAREAWQYLAGERERGEDDTEGEQYSTTRDHLAALGYPGLVGSDAANWLARNGLDPDGTGTVYGATPGYEGDHDLGLAYSVELTED